MRLSIDFSVRCVHAAVGTSVHIFSRVLVGDWVRECACLCVMFYL